MPMPLSFAMIANKLGSIVGQLAPLTLEMTMGCTRLFPSGLMLLAALAAALGALSLPLAAEPQQPSNEQSADATFAKSFIGKTYDDELDIEGWTDVGGGLVSPPIFVHQYQREDGTYLVLTSRELSKETSTTPASYEVADALIVAPVQNEAEFSISCAQGQDETLRFMGVAKGDEGQEWWTDIRRAWEIVLDTGQILAAKTNGVRCTNVSWGQ